MEEDRHVAGGEFSMQWTGLCPKANPRLGFLFLEVKGCLESRENSGEDSQIKSTFAVKKKERERETPERWFTPHSM